MLNARRIHCVHAHLSCHLKNLVRSSQQLGQISSDFGFYSHSPQSLASAAAACVWMGGPNSPRQDDGVPCLNAPLALVNPAHQEQQHALVIIYQMGSSAAGLQCGGPSLGLSVSEIGYVARVLAMVCNVREMRYALECELGFLASHLGCVSLETGCGARMDGVDVQEIDGSLPFSASGLPNSPSLLLH